MEELKEGKILEAVTPAPTISYEYLFEFEYPTFCIYFDRDTKVWYAVADDEDSWDDTIIIQDKENPMVTGMNLFDAYVLTVEEFHKLEKTISEILI